MKKHKFDNCAAWAKGWYKKRDDVRAWWMDLAHCINNDGWSCIQTKQEVVEWILHRFDDDPEWWKQDYGCFSFSNIYSEINRYKKITKYKQLYLSTEDAIILYFRNALAVKSNHLFEGGFKPSNKVLPLKLLSAHYLDGKYSSDGKPKYEAAEMMCDAITRIDQMFIDLPEQYVSEYGEFDYIESQLKHKKLKDIIIPIGSDSDANITKIYTAKELKQTNSIYVETNKDGDELWADMGIFSYCDDFSDDKLYQVSIELKSEQHNWSDKKICTVRNIKEYNCESN